jgi:hypothetical protein
MRIPGTKNSHEFSGHRKTDFFSTVLAKTRRSASSPDVEKADANSRSEAKGGTSLPTLVNYEETQNRRREYDNKCSWSPILERREIKASAAHPHRPK